MLTREQRYAADVVKRVRDVRQDGKLDRDEYKAMAQGLPVLVRNAGLVQALTFVASRSSEAQKRLLEDVAQTLGYDNGQALLKDSNDLHLAEYMRLTEQVIDALQWYKRLAQIELPSIKPA